MRRTKEEAMQTRATVLKAAAQVIAQQGVNAFTIEAVAQEAGITKGGVMHHFRSKEELINGLIDEVVDAFHARLAEELKAEVNAGGADQPGGWLRAYIRTVFLVQYDDHNLIPALAAAVAADHQILDRIRRSYEQSQQAAVEDAADPVQATIIRLAVDGIVFARALKMDVLDPEMSRKVYDELLRLTSMTPVHA